MLSCVTEYTLHPLQRAEVQSSSGILQYEVQKVEKGTTGQRQIQKNCLGSQNMNYKQKIPNDTFFKDAH